MDRAKESIFVGYVEGSTSQWLFWVPDMRRVMKSYRAIFRENKLGGLIYHTGLSLNSAPLRRPVSRPRINSAIQDISKATTMPLDTLISEMDADPALLDIIPYAIPETTPTPPDIASYTTSKLTAHDDDDDMEEVP